MKLFVFTLLLCLAPVSLAQEKKDPKREEAVARFAVGSKAYAKKDFATALSAFQDSYELSGEGALLYNIGTCQRELGQYAAAITSFEDFLAAQPKHPKRKEVLSTIQELNEILSRKQLSIQAKTPGQKFSADLFVAGQRFSCETPCQLAGVPAGQATLKVKSPSPFERRLTLPDGEATIKIEKKKNWPAYTALGFLGASAIAAPLGFLTDCDDICKGIAVGTGIPMLGFGLVAMVFPTDRTVLTSPDDKPKTSSRGKTSRSKKTSPTAR